MKADNYDDIKTILSAIIAIGFIALISYSTLYGTNSALKNREPSKVSVELKSDNVNVQQLADLVNQLPDGPFKSNLYTILAAELGGTSKELNTILMEYVRMQIEKLQKTKTI